MRKFTHLVVVGLAAGRLSSFAAADEHWDTQFGPPGADGLVTSIATRGTDVLITGSFTSAGESGCLGIAKWDGANWSGFGSGFAWGSGPFAYTVTTRGSEVFVGGIFITNISGVTVRNLGRWDGSRWWDVGGGVNGIVTTLLCKGNDLYVGGYFSQAGGITASNIARWDGTNWYTLGKGIYGATNGFPAPYPFSMALDGNGDLIVGGNFLYAGDWTQTGLPPTIESAVTSGHACAKLIQKS